MHDYVELLKLLIYMYPVFPRNGPHLEIPLPLKCHCMFLPIPVLNAALEMSPHGKGSVAIYICTNALHMYTNAWAYFRSCVCVHTHMVADPLPCDVISMGMQYLLG